MFVTQSKYGFCHNMFCFRDDAGLPKPRTRIRRGAKKKKCTLSERRKL